MPAIFTVLVTLFGLIPVSAKVAAGEKIGALILQLGFQIYQLPIMKDLEAAIEDYVKTYGGSVTKDVQGRLASVTMPEQYYMDKGGHYIPTSGGAHGSD